MKILISAFEPFGGEKINSTQKLISHLPAKIESKELDFIILPVVFDKCFKVLKSSLNKAIYDYVICLGQNSQVDKLNVERVAINTKDARIADNEGNKPIDIKIDRNGPDAYFSTLPIKQMVKASLDIDVPAQVSNSAGTFVCNNLMYHTLHMFNGATTKTGFIHVPQTPIQKKTKSSPSMESLTAANGLINMIKSL